MSAPCTCVRLALVAAFTGALLLPAKAQDPQSDDSWFGHQPDRAWLEPYDPTLISRRLLTQFEHEDREAGASSSEWSWNARGAFLLQENLAFGLQLDAPWRWVDRAAESASGFGDLEARAGVVGRFSERTRWGLLMNMKLPTASDDLLGDDLVELRPIAALRWEATTWLELGAGVEYSFTPRDEGADRVSALELKVPVVMKLAEALSGSASYNPRWNDVTGSWRHRLELGLTWLLGPRKDYALTLGGEIPLTDEPFDWKASIALAWYFK